ncbi:hypothetical protein [Microlunatus speluncae]|uniref:hypothetical protein n=1 Tax=Microlunatus speluncae TaxID=2594267 RepID=UPI00126634B6|nr:hypothetical protein [Microlunatus speluncae]
MSREPGHDFTAAFRKVVRATGRRTHWSPFEFVDAWRTFVRQVRDGYDGALYEYQDELFLRARLEAALRSRTLDAWPAWRDLRAESIRIRFASVRTTSRRRSRMGDQSMILLRVSATVRSGPRTCSPSVSLTAMECFTPLTTGDWQRSSRLI